MPRRPRPIGNRALVRLLVWAAVLCLIALVRTECQNESESRRPQTAPPSSRDRRPTRSYGERVTVPSRLVEVDDGDTITIRWGRGDNERVRILGIDAPEVRHSEHSIPYDQSFGPEARAFARRAFANAATIELLRAKGTDQYGRTLAYVFLDGRNYSVMVIDAHLAIETVSHYGNNGIPNEANAVRAAAETAGPPPFEPPYEFRKRMRAMVESRKGSGREPRN